MIYFRFPDKTPTLFELRIFKWIFLPIIFLGILMMLLEITEGRSKCKEICEQKGYPGLRYTPESSYGIRPHKCHCLTAEELKIKKGIPKGTRVF